MTRWKLDPWYPKPFSPVHSARKFSIVDHQIRSQSSSHPVASSRVNRRSGRSSSNRAASRTSRLGHDIRAKLRSRENTIVIVSSVISHRAFANHTQSSNGMEWNRDDDPSTLFDRTTPIDPSTTHRHLDAPGGLTTDLDVEVAHGVGHGRRRCVRARKCRRIDPSIDDRRSSPVGDYFFGGEKAGRGDGTRGGAEGPGDAVKA